MLKYVHARHACSRFFEFNWGSRGSTINRLSRWTWRVANSLYPFLCLLDCCNSFPCPSRIISKQELVFTLLSLEIQDLGIILRSHIVFTSFHNTRVVRHINNVVPRYAFFGAKVFGSIPWKGEGASRLPHDKSKDNIATFHWH